MFTIARFTLVRIFEPAFLFLMAFGLVISYSTGGNQSIDSVINDTGAGNLDMATNILLILSAIIGIFIGSSEIPRDLHTRMITILLSKPISRQKYVIGRFLGSWALVTILYVTWTVALGIIKYMNMPDLFNGQYFMINFLYIFSLAPICAIAITVSTFLEDVPSMIVSFMILALSFIVGSIPIIIKVFPNADLGKILLLFYYLLPNSTYLFKSFDAPYQIYAYLCFALSLSAIILKIGILHFNEKDLV